MVNVGHVCDADGGLRESCRDGSSPRRVTRACTGDSDRFVGVRRWPSVRLGGNGNREAALASLPLRSCVCRATQAAGRFAPPVCAVVVEKKSTPSHWSTGFSVRPSSPDPAYPAADTSEVVVAARRIVRKALLGSRRASGSIGQPRQGPPRRAGARFRARALPTPTKVSGRQRTPGLDSRCSHRRWTVPR